MGSCDARPIVPPWVHGLRVDEASESGRDEPERSDPAHVEIAQAPLSNV